MKEDCHRDHTEAVYAHTGIRKSLHGRSCVTQISLNSVFISDSHSFHLWCSTQKKPSGGERGLTSIACNNGNVHYSGCMATSLLHKLTFECRARGEDFLQGCRMILTKKKLKQKLRSSLVDPVEKENFPGKWPAQYPLWEHVQFPPLPQHMISLICKLVFQRQLLASRKQHLLPFQGWNESPTEEEKCLGECSHP